VYQVDRARDGKSFSNRRVVAIQHGRPIFNMTASFQVPERGLEHQVPMPRVPGPDGLADAREIPQEILDRVPDKMRRFLTHERPFEIRPVEPLQILEPQQADPRRHFWIRTTGTLPDDPHLHRNLLAYVSDYQLVATTTLPHRVSYAAGNLQMA